MKEITVVVPGSQGHRHAVRAVAVSADGSIAASGSEDRTVATWDLNKGARVLELLGHRGAVRAVCLTPVWDYFADRIPYITKMYVGP